MTAKRRKGWISGKGGTMIEKYSKSEIVEAIKYKSRFDSRIEGMLVAIIKKQKQERAYNEWEIVQRQNIEALKDLAEYQEKLNAKYSGKYKFTKLTAEEAQMLLDKAKYSLDCEEKEQEAYSILKEIEDELCCETK